MSSSRRIDVDIAADAEGIPDAASLRSWAEAALDAAGVAKDAELSMRVVDATEMQALNQSFRGSDRPTNVLSFPAEAIAGLPDDCGIPLGDIAICAEVVADEARAQGKAATDHWIHMVVHGILHLAGFDHDTDEAAEEMERLETEILARAGVGNPYLAH